jgi:hypothetical protein
MTVTHPELGLFFGAARSLISEYPTHRIMCLDVESNNSTVSFGAIDRALQHLNSVDNVKQIDAEFVERNGMFYISRIVPDKALNKAESDCKTGMEMQDTIISGHKSIIRLISDQVGTVDKLLYAEMPEQPPLADDEVEVEMRAMSLNFKVGQPLQLLQHVLSMTNTKAGSGQLDGLYRR